MKPRSRLVPHVGDLFLLPCPRAVHPKLAVVPLLPDLSRRSDTSGVLLTWSPLYTSEVICPCCPARAVRPERWM